MWRAQTLDLKMALLVSNYDHIYACFTLDKYPRPAEKSQYEGSMSLHSALSEEIITFEQARDIAIRCHERTISHQQRWVNHYQNRLPTNARCSMKMVALSPEHRNLNQAGRY